MTAALRIVWRDVKALIPYARNARTHSAKQVEEIATSFKTFGWTNPVLIDEAGTIIAGHGRVMAATAVWDEGQEIPGVKRGKVPCIVKAGLSDQQRRLLVLADNRIALNAGWDQAMLAEELQAIGGEMASVAGFTAAELERFMGTGEQAQAPQLEGVRYSLIVECSGEQHQASLLERLEKEGLKCRPLMS